MLFQSKLRFPWLQHRPKMLTTIVLLLVCLYSPALAVLTVPESAPIGHIVGYVEGRPQIGSESRYLVVFPDRSTEKILGVDDRSGEITTLVKLDYERHRKFQILAVPLTGGEGIPVTVEIEDENNHSPTFASEKVVIEISEYARIGAEYRLPQAADQDGPKFNIQKYRIAQGNVNNVFKITSRKINEVLYADLVVNGQLDREYRDKYELIVEAIDGGTPEKIGRLRVQIVILDANDNVPIFSKPRYSISIPSSTPIGANILTVEATDGDIGENSRLSYRLQKTRTNSMAFFSISQKGVISTTQHLLPGAVYDLVVVANDHGQPTLETTAFVSVTVQGSATDEPALDIFWLTDTNTAHLLENTTLGAIVARISLNEKFRDSTLVMSGCPALCLQQSDASHIYLVMVCGIFDRETMEEYPLKFVITKDGEIVLEHPVLLTIGDVNDNAPIWNQLNMHIILNRTGNDHPPILSAIDLDRGANGRIRYSILDTDLVSIDAETGRLIVLKELDCSHGTDLRFRVKAEDQGEPQLSSELQVTAELVDSAGQPPQFEKPLYEVMMKEDVEKGTCLLKVVANNSICGGISRLKYQWQDSIRNGGKLFSLDSTSGTICLDAHLDFEKAQTHRLAVQAIDSNGLSSSCLVWIRVLDVNDNSPVFHPTDYNISLREGEPPKEPILAVSATDADHGSFGELYYFISDANSPFRVDPNTGEVYLTRRLTQGRQDLIIQAKDSTGTTAEHPASVHITVISADAPSPSFTRSKYVFKTSEDILPGISIGSVQAFGNGKIKYSIYSGDTGKQFGINPETGRITVTRYLDADNDDKILLNIQADLENGGSNHTQVVVEIEDHNDNPPVFPVDIVEITIREDQRPLEPFYVVLADDKDRKKNGEVSYSLLSVQPPCPLVIQSHTGQLHLTEKLDFETTKDYRIRVKATDHGVPPKSANITILLHVSDVNDNVPLFLEESYEAAVVENSPAMTPVVRVQAQDSDSGESGKILYRITNGSEYFGIDEKTGEIYTNKELDREEKERFNLTIVAEDRGNPPLASSIHVTMKLLDVNDNPPNCASIQTLVVPSDADIHSPFGSIVATDPDNGENGTVVYRLQQTHPLFVLTANGDVLLRRMLTDSDSIDYRLSIIAADQGVPKKSAVCHVPIKVTSGVSLIKIEEPFERTIRVPQDCTVDCRIKRINATGVTKWQIQSSEISSHFFISNSWLHLISPPSSLPPWMLTLVLSDKEGRQKHIQLKILPPISKNLKATIPLPSTLPIGTKVAVIGEIQPDYYYQMANKSDLFELDQVSGGIYLNGRLRDHSNENIHLFFEKTSALTQESEDIEMEFAIAPTASLRPIFKESEISVEIPEETAIDSVVATVIATETNSSITYRLLGKEEGSFFGVDEHTGDVVLKRVLDCHEGTRYNILIEASSSSNGRATAFLRVDVIDGNNNRPEIKSEAKIFLFPDTKGPIHTAVALDRDLGRNGEITYELVRNPKTGYRIDSATGEIFVEKLPTADENIIIRATDNGSPQLFTDQKIEVKVMNSSKRWLFFPSPEYRLLLNDSLPLKMEIAKFEGNGNAQLRAISLPFAFVFDEANGILKATEKPTSGIFSFTILATSTTGEVDWTTVTLIIKGLGEDSLRISSSSCGTVTVSENVELHHFKRIIVTGSKGNARFRIQGHQSLFTIDSQNGTLSSSQLDREQKSEHLLVIIAEEDGRNDSCTVRVTVADVNDNSPQFSPITPQLLTLSDVVKQGDAIHKLQALDMDTGANGKVIFDLVDDASGIFDVNPESGAIIYRRDVSYSQKEWMIRIKAKDMAIEPKSSDRLIRIKDERSNPRKTEPRPVFLRAEYISSVEEGHDRGLNVAKVSASQRDSRITYSIIEGNVDNAFEIDGEGIVRTAQELDYEIRSNYQLKIIATGGFSDEVSTSLQVRVLNLNDNPPTFPKNKNRKILESVPAGSYITTFTANDADMSDILEYSLLTEEKRFSIDKFTGVIHSLLPLDYEEAKEIQIRAAVFDGKNRVEGGFTILLVDVNDNPPSFSKSFYDLAISPSSQIDDIIIKLVATDRDSGENGRVSYSLEGHQEMFAISPDGVLSLITPVSLGLEYMTTVIATDHGHPRLSTSVPVRITVAKSVIKSSPQFKKPLYEFMVREDVATNLPIGNVSASLEPEWYRILDGEKAKQFRIDRFGTIYPISKLDRESQEVHQFDVEVGSGRGNTVTTVRIKLGDVNDNPPTIEVNSRIPIAIRDGLKNGDVLYRMQATDPDSGENGQFFFRILAGNEYSILSIAPESGAIMFNEWNEEILSLHKNATWVTQVEIRDKGYPSLFSIVYLDMTVSISSWSATAPFFVQSQYITYVEEMTKRDTVIFTAKAVNRAGLPIAGLVYSLKDTDGTFSINSTSGEIYARTELDFETISSYKMSLSASDSRGRSAVVDFEVKVTSVDEYAPVFSKPRYTFQVPITSPVGSGIGAVRAVDADGGPHGIVRFGIEGEYNLVAIDAKTGEISLRKSLTNRQNLTIEQITVIAYSSSNMRSRATVYLEIGPFRNSLSATASAAIKITAASLLFVIVVLLSIIICCLLSKRHKDIKQMENNPRKQVFSVSQGHLAKMADPSRMSPAAHPLTKNLQPKANVQTNSMTSSTSTQSGLRSAMSHRDHISTRSQPDSGIDPDTISQTSSVTDYLVSLGVNPNPIPPKPRHRRRDTVDSHLNDLIYAKVEDVVGPGPLDVSKRLDYLDNSPIIVQSTSAPSFQPMSEIFSEISRLKEEERRGPREYVQIEI